MSLSASDRIQFDLTLPTLTQSSRLDHALKNELPEYSRACLSEWIKQGWVRVNDAAVVKPNAKVHGQEHIVIDALQSPHSDDMPEPIPLTMVYEDEHVLVIDKPAGLVVHPAAGHAEGTLVNALLHHDADLAKLPRAGLIHRIDKDTTGLLLIAKQLESYTHLVEALQRREIHREYEAIVNGTVVAGGCIDQPIGRHPKQRKHMAVSSAGKPARTHYRVLQRFEQHSHLALTLETGRTHQIRVHLAHLKHPIVGDPLYGGRPRFPKGADEACLTLLRNFKRQALHARRLSFDHPHSQKFCQFESELPEDMVSLLTALRANFFN